jgi:hypothetical protein
MAAVMHVKAVMNHRVLCVTVNLSSGGINNMFVSGGLEKKKPSVGTSPLSAHVLIASFHWFHFNTVPL